MAALVMTSTSSYADCNAYPAIRAKATLLSCRGFTVQPSTLRMSELDGKPRKKDDFYLDDQSSAFRGTLLEVKFDEVNGVPEGKDAFPNAPGHGWKRDGYATLYTRQAASEVCSPKKFSQVVTDSQCCDTLPRQGSCMVSGIQRVYVNPSEKQFQNLGSSAYFTSGLDD